MAGFFTVRLLFCAVIRVPVLSSRPVGSTVIARVPSSLNRMVVVLAALTTIRLLVLSKSESLVMTTATRDATSWVTVVLVRTSTCLTVAVSAGGVPVVLKAYVMPSMIKVAPSFGRLAMPLLSRMSNSSWPVLS